MHFVDDEDLEAPLGRPCVGHRVQLTDVVNPGGRGGVDLQHVEEPPLADADAGLADAARFGRGAARAIGTDTVQPLGDDPRGRGLAHPAHPGHDESMRDPVRRKGVLQRPHHRLLPDQVGKGGGPVLAGKNLIGGLVGHEFSPDEVSLNGGGGAGKRGGPDGRKASVAAEITPSRHTAISPQGFS